MARWTIRDSTLATTRGRKLALSLLSLGILTPRAGANTNLFCCNSRISRRRFVERFSSNTAISVLVSWDFDVRAFRLMACQARSLPRVVLTLSDRLDVDSLLVPVGTLVPSAIHLSPAKVPLGPFRSSETCA